MGGGDALEQGEPAGGERDAAVAPVFLVGLSGDQAALQEVLDPGADGAGTEVELAHELALRDARWLVQPAQGDERLELGAVEPVLGEGGLELGVDGAGEAPEAGDDRDRRQVEVGARLAPSREQPVDRIRRAVLWFSVPPLHCMVPLYSLWPKLI